MSRWGRDPEAAADDLIVRSLGAIDVRGRVLAAYQAARLPSLLAGMGIACTVWNRRAVDTGAAQGWPPAGPFDVALLRLPKAKDEQEMAAHACLSVLAEGGRLIVYGGNEEGIRSAASLLEGVCGQFETRAVGRHGRVLAVDRRTNMVHLRGSLPAWRSVAMLEIAGRSHPWVSYPGVFAADRIDEGTALLIAALPPLHAHARVLDYGCGSGVIGAATLAQESAIALDLLDNDAIALEAARENVPSTRLILGSSLAKTRTDYDAIMSNPPLHQGFAETRALLDRLVAEAPRHLRAGGCLHVVVQRRVPLDRTLARHFADVTIAAENGRYRVWRAVNALSAQR